MVHLVPVVVDGGGGGGVCGSAEWFSTIGRNCVAHATIFSALVSGINRSVNRVESRASLAHYIRAV